MVAVLCQKVFVRESKTRAGKEGECKGKGAVRAERSVIGTRRSSCICKLEGRFVVEHEVVMRTRDKKRKKERRIINKARDRVRSDAATHPVLRLSVAPRGSLQHIRVFVSAYCIFVSD